MVHHAFLFALGLLSKTDLRPERCANEMSPVGTGLMINDNKAIANDQNLVVRLQKVDYTPKAQVPRIIGYIYTLANKQRYFQFAGDVSDRGTTLAFLKQTGAVSMIDEKNARDILANGVIGVFRIHHLKPWSPALHVTIDTCKELRQ